MELSSECFWSRRQKHNRPHFHAYYQEDEIEMIAGSLPKRQQRLVEAWAELHLEELMDDWKRLQSGQSPFSIDPLQ